MLITPTKAAAPRIRVLCDYLIQSTKPMRLGINTLMLPIRRARIREGKSPIQGHAGSKRTKILTQSDWLQSARHCGSRGGIMGGKLPGLHYREVVGGYLQDGEGEQRSWVNQVGRADASAHSHQMCHKRFSSSSNLDSPAPALRGPALPVQCLPKSLHAAHPPEAAPSAACTTALQPCSHPPAPGVSCLPCPMAPGGTRSCGGPIREADRLGRGQGQGVLSIPGKARAASLSSGARTALGRGQGQSN